jgi:YggT family protein
MFGPGCSGETAAAQVVCLFVTVLTIAIFVRAIMSWFNLDPYNPLVQLLGQITDPIIEPIRRIMPRLGMIDLSPLVAIIVLRIVGGILAEFLDQQALG